MTDFGRSSSKRVRDQVFLAVGSAGWLGLAPVAPGTFGALFGVLIHVGVVYSLPESFHITGLILAFFLVCMGTIALSPWAEEYWQCKDPGHFVLDEVAGYLFVPLLFQGGNLWSTVVWGFCLFRVIDIIKFPPARQIDQKMKGGWGILLDDLVSALYAALLMSLLRGLHPGLFI